MFLNILLKMSTNVFIFIPLEKNGKQYHIQLSSKGHQKRKILSKLAKNTMYFFSFLKEKFY